MASGSNKFYLVFGGFLGFVLALVGGLWIGNTFAIVLRNASIGCVVGALLGKGFEFVLAKNIAEAKREQLYKLEQAELEAAHKQNKPLQEPSGAANKESSPHSSLNH